MSSPGAFIATKPSSPPTETIAILLGLVVLILIPQLSIPPGHIVTGGDGMNPELDPVVAWHHLSSTWFGAAGLGFDGSSARPVLFPFVIGAMGLRGIGLSPEAICRLWYAALFVLQGAGVAMLADTLFRPRLPRVYLVLVGFFAAVNPCALISLHGPYLTSQLSVAALPALIAVGVKYVRRRRFIDYLACVVLMALAATGDANPAVFAVEALVLLAVVLLWYRPDRIVPLALLVAAFSSINAIWIAPSYLTLHHDLPFLGPASAGYSDATLRVVSEFSAWPHSVRLVGEYLFFNMVAGQPYLAEGAGYDSNPLLVAATCVVPVCVLVALIFGARAGERSVLKLGAILVGALFLAKGAAPPFGGLFVFLVDHNSLFRGFRDSFAKFEWVVVIAYALLLARSLIDVSQIRNVAVRRVACAGIAGAVAFAGYPILLGHLFWPHVVVQIPARYSALASFLNRTRDGPAVAEIPMAPDVFDAYRWGYIGAGLNSQLIERPVLSGAHRLLSPINENLAAQLEHPDRLGNAAIAPWLGLYGFGGVVADDSSDPAIYSPGQGSNAPPSGLPQGRVAWHDHGLRYVAFDNRLVNPKLYVSRKAISGASTEADIGLSCLALDGCKSVAFVTGGLPEHGNHTREFIFRRPLLWTTRLAGNRRESQLRVFVDDANHTDDITGGSGPSDRQTVFPTHPAIVRISPRGLLERGADAVVAGTSALASPRRFCARPNLAAEMSINPDKDASGFGLLALTYESDRDAAADLLIESAAGGSETRLHSGASHESIVRTLPLDSGTRARIVLEARPTAACVVLDYFAFARFRSTSEYVRTHAALRGEPTLYQRLNPNPLQQYTAAAKLGVSAVCNGVCVSARRAQPSSKVVRMHTVASGAAPMFEASGFANEACSRDSHAIFRGEGIRLIPGLRYVAHVTVRTGAPAHVRTAILTEDEFGIAESAANVAGGTAQLVDLPFAAPNPDTNAVLYTWVDTPPQDPRACILSATIDEESPKATFETDSQALWQGDWDATADGPEHYSLRLKGLRGTPVLVVLNQTYDDRWQLKTTAVTTAAHVVVNGGVNGWFVTGNGDADVVVRYAGADVTKWALIWGVSAALISIGLAFWRVPGGGGG